MHAGELDEADIDFMGANPVWFIENVLGQKLWSKQAEVVESVWRHKRTAVASAHGTGKTNIAARIGLTWLITRPNSIIVTTAPTGRQVKKQLWKEVRSAISSCSYDFGGSLLPKAPELQINGEEWQMLGFSTDSGDSFQGWHSEGGNLFIFDEATGIDPQIWEAVKGCLTGPRDRLLCIGNPTDPTGMFADMYKREGVNDIRISAFDVPNVIERREVIPGLTSYEWILEMQEECGPGYEQHPDYVSRVLGLFPDKDDRALVPLSWIDAAEERWRKYNDEGKWNTDCLLGIDVARMGRARTIIAEGYSGRGVKELHKEPPQSTMETSGRIIELGRELDSKSWRIDADGIGAGVADRCAEIDPQSTVEMRGGMRSEVLDAEDNPRYLNTRAEWYWTLRERLDPQFAGALALVPDKALRAQLSSIRWATTSRGLKKIESKDEMAKRGLKSPDEADAVMYSMADAEGSYDVISTLEALTSM